MPGKTPLKVKEKRIKIIKEYKRYGSPNTVIGEKLGISRERVRVIWNEYLSSLEDDGKGETDE